MAITIIIIKNEHSISGSYLTYYLGELVNRILSQRSVNGQVLIGSILVLASWFGAKGKFRKTCFRTRQATSRALIQKAITDNPSSSWAFEALVKMSITRFFFSSTAFYIFGLQQKKRKKKIDPIITFNGTIGYHILLRFFSHVSFKESNIDG